MTTKRLPIRLIAVSALTLGCQFFVPTFAEDANNEDARLKRAFVRIESHLHQSCRDDQTPGAALAITTRERLLIVFVHGVADVPSATPVSEQTLFAIGSIGKSFTAVTLLALQDDGKFDFQKPVDAYLPWWDVDSETPIRGHDLVTHTAGIPGYRGDMSCSIFETAWLNDAPLHFTPGKRFHYSSNAYSILGHLIEVCSGKGYGEMVREKILAPLGMTRSEPVLVNAMRTKLASSYVPLHNGRRPRHPDDSLVDAGFYEYTKGAGSVCCTAPDLTRYLRMLLNRGKGVLSQRSFELLIRPGFQLGPDHFYAYGLDIGKTAGRTLIRHGGGCFGFRSNMVGDLEAGVGVVLLANGPVNMAVADSALSAVRAAIAGDPIPEAPAPPPAIEIDASDYEATYTTTAGRSIEFKADGNNVILLCNNQSATLVPHGRDRFYSRHPKFRDFLLQFQRHQGKVAEVFYGSDWYTNERHDGPTEFETPDSWSALTGHFTATTLPPTSFRVALRKGQLLFVSPGGAETALKPLGENAFQVGDTPEWLRFTSLIDGRALRVDYSGMTCYRK